MFKIQYFDIKELVSPVVYKQWGEQAWMFFDPAILQDLLTIRETWNSPIIINNWSNGGNLRQCGLRSNLDDLVLEKSRKDKLYLSFHTMGKAFDLHDKLGRNQKLWEHCNQLIINKRLKTFSRLEDYKKTNVWVHIDSANSDTRIF